MACRECMLPLVCRHCVPPPSALLLTPSAPVITFYSLKDSKSNSDKAFACTGPSTELFPKSPHGRFSYYRKVTLSQKPSVTPSLKEDPVPRCIFPMFSFPPWHLPPSILYFLCSLVFMSVSTL